MINDMLINNDPAMQCRAVKAFVKEMRCREAKKKAKQDARRGVLRKHTPTLSALPEVEDDAVMGKPV